MSIDGGCPTVRAACPWSTCPRNWLTSCWRRVFAATKVQRSAPESGSFCLAFSIGTRNSTSVLCFVHRLLDGNYNSEHKRGAAPRSIRSRWLSQDHLPRFVVMFNQWLPYTSARLLRQSVLSPHLSHSPSPGP